MMINQRLIGAVPESKKYIALNVVLQWLSLGANIALMVSISWLLACLFTQSAQENQILWARVCRAAFFAGAVWVHHRRVQNELSFL